jgi:hypothetical protein
VVCAPADPPTLAAAPPPPRGRRHPATAALDRAEQAEERA